MSKIGRHHCGTWLEFVGIAVQAPHNRWDFCPTCKRYWVSGENGSVLDTVVEPAKGLFKPVPEGRAAAEPTKRITSRTPSAPGCGIGAMG